MRVASPTSLKRLLALLPLSLALAAPAQAADFTLEVQGLKSGEGEILVAVFQTAQGWLRQPVTTRRAAASTMAGGRLTLNLSGLPEGPLALSIVHDLNANGRLDMNPMGMPIEPYAFSNNAAGSFGPPRFEDAQISPKPGASVAVRLN